MQRILFIILFTVFASSAKAQVKLPAFEASNASGYDNNYWFLKYLSGNYTEYITLTEFSDWNHRNIIGSLALRHDSAFIITQSSYQHDMPQVQRFVHHIPKAYYKIIIDSLKSMQAFSLKDEAEVQFCLQKKDTIINGKKIVKESSTATIANGLQTLLVFYSQKKYRFVGYYELGKFEVLCPQSVAWDRANKVRNYLKSILIKQARIATSR